MTGHAHSEVLVGREADLAVLRDALKRARHAEPSTVLVGGEAGVGKTRLVEEFCQSLTTDPVRVLAGQCLELGEEGLPFAPFAGALRDLLRAEGPEVLDGHERELARLLPELGPPPEGEARRGLLFNAVAAVLGRAPLVLVIEDLHWADRSTRDLIAFLVRAARLPQLLLITTYRTDELHRGHPLRPFLGELDRVRGVLRLELDRLDREGTSELLTHLVGAEPDPRTVDAVNERAQGNPFFIEQFAAAADPSCDFPATLRDLLLARVDQLPEPAQRVLRVAAVGGTRFGHELLARVAGMPEADLESALRAVVAAQLVVVVDADGDYEFRHALVREAVHDDLLPGEHARLHARYAQAVEAEPHLVAAGRAPAEIAHHWHAAHDRPRALVTAKIAADEAKCRFAYGEQVRLLDRVLQLWEEVPDARSLLGLDHLDLLEESALAALHSGEYSRALMLTKAALGDLDAEAEPLRAGRLLVRRAKLLRTAGKSDARPECDEALRLLTSAPHSPEQVRLLAELAHLISSVDAARGFEVAQLAMAGANESGDLIAIVSAEVAYGSSCSGRQTAVEALPVMREATHRARAAGDFPSFTRGLISVSDSLFELGRYAESADAAAEGLPEADRIGVGRTTGVYLLANHAEALIALGRWDEADARLAEAARLDPPETMALPWLRLRARIRLARGREDAETLVTRAATFLRRPYLSTEGRLATVDLRLTAALGSAPATTAVETARAALAEPNLTVLPRYAWAILAHAAEAAADAGDTELAAQVAGVAAGLPQRYPAQVAFAAQTRAHLEGGAGRWAETVEAWRADGHRHELASALLRQAEAQAATGDRAAAAGAIAESVAIAAALGAVPLTEAADTLSRRLGIRPSAHRDELLTVREREVLRLVAEGHSNSRIAAGLYISPKTASVHVSRIIAKLQVSNRGEAAAVARRLGLLDELP
ncbi:ATP-binding protein [Paractinoplanes abujensis]|uniref:DNA-binding CsgD family transcriptional regulator n=1 Tax=Paractinoplanes abujensis TaxID=882441 RepID=A0A7W7CTL3_9ACTN|nr:helix-turn-helix transcriptional regulator [Actinoplanes abujensis]MBB4694454.1 DNA-binding CsgD family transcriptional regulator [Actinoplanes abujensis]